MAKTKGKEMKELNLHEMGRRIRVRRENLDMSRESLAEGMGVSPQFVADIEYGNKGVSVKRLYMLSQILGVTADYLLAGNVYATDEDQSAIRVCDEIMGILKKCDTDQLKGIRNIAEIYADGVGRKTGK